MKKIPTQVELRYLIREFQTQMRFKHECILEVYGHSEDPSGFPILVMELGGPSLGGPGDSQGREVGVW